MKNERKTSDVPTERQGEVMRGLLGGHGIRKIARELGVTPSRVCQVRDACGFRGWVRPDGATVTPAGVRALDRLSAVRRALEAR